MASNDQSWQNRISGDPWKNVILLECQKVVDKEWHSPTAPPPSPKPSNLTGTKLREIALGYEVIKSYKGNSAENAELFAQSFLVWQTGRLFVVGPTKDAAKRVAQFGRKHLHIVLLNWEESHRDGMKDLLSQKWESVTIWTSYWIWEETLRYMGEEASGELRKLKFFDPNRSEHPKERAAALFEQSVVWNLTCGVSLAMSYSVASQPYLRAEFLCNHHKITIDPALDWLWTAAAGNWPKAVVKTEILANLFRSLYLGIASDSKRKEPEVYRDEALSRHLGLLDLYCDSDRHTTSSSADGWSLVKTEGEGFMNPVDLTPGEVPPDTVGSIPTEPPSTQDDDGTVRAGYRCEEILAKTAVVILCGGLMNKAERELIDPGYELDIAIVEDPKKLTSTQTSDKEQKDRTERMPILEWRLHELNRWVRDFKDLKSLPVLLLTTPETEDIVDGCCKRYEKRWNLFDRTNRKTHRLKIKQVTAQLIPWIQAPEDPKDPTQWFETDDGGWQLSPRGHMDCLRILAQRHRLQNRGGTKWLKGKEFAIIYAFNNLGNVVNAANDATCQNLVKLAQAQEKDLAVELFEYQKKPDDDDSRWPQLSYCTDPSQPDLLKPSYDRPTPPASSKRYYSSLTWYVKLDRLGGPDFETKTARPEFVWRQNPSVKVRVFGQDIDRITHPPSRVKVLGIPYFTQGEPPSSLYQYPRYLGVRTQDHIRDKDFGKAFKEIGKLGPLPFLGLQINEEEKPPLLISWPKHQEYVWGGGWIAMLKGLPGLYRNMRLAETWEVSTHERDQSQVMLSVNNKVPLREAIEGKDLDYMAKYLDCHGALSLQVHPSRETGEFLWNHDFQVRDKLGKEESFFVLKKAPGSRVHLFLGFDRQALRPLAEKIRPRLESASEREWVTKEELIEIWNDLCDGIKKLCLDGIADGLFAHERASREWLTREVFNHPSKTEQNMIMGVLTYHMGVSGCHPRWAGPGTLGKDFPMRVLGPYSCNPPWSGAGIFGKEYLFAAVAILNMIRKLKGFVEQLKKDWERTGVKTPEGFLSRAKDLFGDKCLSEAPASQYFTEHPLLKFFHTEVIPADNCWVRILPGTLHAWQGGGNFLIELGHRSDNTFRILDYGREISDYPRDMHYEEAMYALDDKGFYDDQEVKRLIIPSKSDEYPCHELLSCQVYSASDKPFSIKSQDDWSFLMNPDGEMSLIAKDDTGFRCRMSAGRCRTVLIKGDTQVEVQPEQPDNRILHFFKKD